MQFNGNNDLKQMEFSSAGLSACFQIVITNYIHHSFSYREKERKISRIFFADLRICGINE